jgi:hypothetical protein
MTRGNAEFVFDPFPFAGFEELLAGELGDAKGGRGLSGQRLQETKVVAGIFLLAHPRPEVDQPDQLPLAHEGKRQPDAFRPQRAQGWRVEIELVHLDHALGTGEVGQQRVVGRNVEGTHLARKAFL